MTRDFPPAPPTGDTMEFPVPQSRQSKESRESRESRQSKERKERRRHSAPVAGGGGRRAASLRPDPHPRPRACSPRVG
ncbi:hypothetical protein AB0J63_27040 [Streptosporangium canum]|uniref:hypothetical protein n=1 Tax=Streptosporangium canum TaxID=324952 RepID=UPI0034273B81